PSRRSKHGGRAMDTVDDPDLPAFTASILLLARSGLVGSGGDLVAHVPKIFIEPAFHSLLQNFHGRSHGADDAASDDALGELEMVETEKLHAFVEIEQALGNVVQTEEFFVTAIEVADSDAGAAKLLVKSVAETRTDVEQRKKSRRIKPAAVPEAGANEVIVAGRNGLQDVKQADGRLNHLDGAADQARGVAVVGVLQRFEGTAEFESRSFQEQLRTLVYNQKSHLVWVQQLGGRFLQGEQFVGAQIALVVGRSLAGKNRFGEFVAMCPSKPVQDCKCSAGRCAAHCGSSSGVTIWPSRMWMMRSPYSAASGLCVIIITVCLRSLLDWRSMPRTTLELFESKLPVGSSASTMAGRLIRARASATRCCSPPDSSLGRCSRRWPMPSISVIFFRNTGSGFPPAMSAAISMFERALSVGRRLNFWNTNPIFFLRNRVRSPSERVEKSTSSMITLPESG